MLFYSTLFGIHFFHLLPFCEKPVVMVGNGENWKKGLLVNGISGFFLSLQSH